MIKRITLFVLTNILVVVTISLLLNVLGVRGYMTSAGIDYGALLIFCFVWGMGGAFISLALSRVMAKWMTGARVIDPQAPGKDRWLVETVHTLSRRAKLPAMPQVAIYPGNELNAFATGPTKARALVAVSEGLLSSMSPAEIEGVIGHEIAHIQNGDMVTMTLIQGVVNAFTMFLARVLAFMISQNVDEDRRYAVQLLLTTVFDLVISLFGLLLVCWFSRRRELRADRGSVQLTGDKSKMIRALDALGRTYGRSEGGAEIQALKISAPRRALNLLATHPPLEERIAALQAA